VLECVVNVSEGRDVAVLDGLRGAAGDDLLDVHTGAWHHRSVFTLVGEAAPRRLAAAAVASIDLRAHEGVHPRIGAVDVVPFVALEGSTPADALAARDAFAAWMEAELEVPCDRYGPERTLPEVRRAAAGLPGHPTAGRCAVGARGLLVAYNLWLAEPDLDAARRAAAAVRGDGIRALGLPVGDRVQVSMNLVEPGRVGPADAWDRVSTHVAVAGAELVGLLPEAVLRAVPRARWTELDLAAERTIEARLAGRGR
jgi:glutamate formiminotransferase